MFRKSLPLLSVFLIFGACKIRENSDEVESNITNIPTDKYIFENLSEEGGLKGTSDDCVGVDDHLEKKLPRFSINGGIKEYPSYQIAKEKEWNAGLKDQVFANSKLIEDMIAAKGNSNKEKLEASRKQALEWLESIQKYVYKDMNDQDSSDPNNNFRLDNDKVRGRWFHMPWLHTPIVESKNLPGRGRECIWGLTREVDLKGPVTDEEYPLITGHNFIGQNWGSAFYNQMAASTLAKVFPKGDQFVLEGEKLDWPVGSVVMKLLFSAIPDEEDVSKPLQGAWKIKGYINKEGKKISFRERYQARKITDLSHIQMDVMYKFGEGYNDWIFGTYAYDANDNSGKYWQKMRPIGLMWGVQANQSITLSEDFLPNGYFNDMNNDGDTSHVKEDGMLRRMNGPADHPTSSCYQCHARAQWPPVSSKRMPFAPKSFKMHHQIDLMHYWTGEEASLKKCQKLVEADVMNGRRALKCPKVDNCKPGGDVRGCMPVGEAPVVPGSVGLGFSAQLQLALENIQNLRTKAEEDLEN